MKHWRAIATLSWMVTATSLVVVLGCASAGRQLSLAVSLGFLPGGWSVKQRSHRPAFSMSQARQDGVQGVNVPYQVRPPGEYVHFGDRASLVVFELNRNHPEMERDFPSAAKAASRLRELLATEPNTLLRPIPDLPFANAGIYVQAKLRYLDLPWGRVVMMLAQYTQEAHPPPPNNEWLLVWIQGLSHEAIAGRGGYYVSGRMHITHPKLLDADGAYANEEKIGIAEGQRLLESFPDESFVPPIGDFERMLHEIRLRPK